MTSGRIPIRFLPVSGFREALLELGVDPYGVRIMQPKGVPYLVSLGPVRYPAAAILKQEMLSLGGDCALPREAVTGRLRETRCILIANSSHLEKLRAKLRRQPFGLAALSDALGEAIGNHEKKERELSINGRRLRLGRRPLVMAIVNLTPDSFSGDGLAGRDPEWLLEHARILEAQGAGMIDLGAESSRPGAVKVPEKEELARLIPVVRALARKLKIPVSVDTYKAEVARQALDNGASVVNDITGLRDPAMLRVCARSRCGVVVMHMRGTPATMKELTRYDSLVGELHDFFSDRIAAAADAGIAFERLVLDPGIGFAKEARQSMHILNNLSQFKSLGRPLMVGASRKSFIGKATGAAAHERLPGSLAACVVAAANGADILRVHDVKETVQALSTACAIFDS